MLFLGFVIFIHDFLDKFTEQSKFLAMYLCKGITEQVSSKGKPLGGILTIRKLNYNRVRVFFLLEVSIR